MFLYNFIYILQSIKMKTMVQLVKTLFFVLIISCFSCQNRVNTELSEKLFTIQKQHSFSGSILVAFHDSVVIDTAYGFSNQEKNIRNTPNTIFPIASITKLFTKQSILQLIEKNEITLSDTISEYFDHVMFADKIQIKHLLHHQSGLPDIHNVVAKYSNPWELNKPVSEYELIDTINSFKQLNFKPGSRNEYSNSNYLTLAKIIENVSKKSLEDFFHENIFSPFGMHQSDLLKEHSKIEGHAEGSFTRNGRRVYTPDFNFKNFWGSGNAFSTTHDLFKYYLNTQKILSPEIGEQLVQHTGLYPGFRTYYKAVPEIGLVIVILCNNGDFNPQFLVDAVLDHFSKILENEAPKINNNSFQGNYTSSYLGKTISIEISYSNQKYYYNKQPLIFIGNNTFIDPKSNFMVLSFNNKKSPYLKINDNGLILIFEKE